MSTQHLKIALILCSCGKSLEDRLDYFKMQNYFENGAQITKIFNFNDLCFKGRLSEFIDLVQSKDFDR
ncbi:MAG: hypothetical protein ACFFD2_28835, partial [Promethearchaeota archaeon]